MISNISSRAWPWKRRRFGLRTVWAVLWWSPQQAWWQEVNPALIPSEKQQFWNDIHQKYIFHERKDAAPSVWAKIDADTVQWEDVLTGYSMDANWDLQITELFEWLDLCLYIAMIITALVGRVPTPKKKSLSVHGLHYRNWDGVSGLYCGDNILKPWFSALGPYTMNPECSFWTGFCEFTNQSNSRSYGLRVTSRELKLRAAGLSTQYNVT